MTPPIPAPEEKAATNDVTDVEVMILGCRLGHDPRSGREDVRDWSSEHDETSAIVRPWEISRKEMDLPREEARVFGLEDAGRNRVEPRKGGHIGPPQREVAVREENTRDEGVDLDQNLPDW